MNKLANFDCGKVYATEEEVKKKMLNLSSKQSIKINIDIYLNDLNARINNCFEREYSQMSEK